MNFNPMAGSKPGLQDESRKGNPNTYKVVSHEGIIPLSLIMLSRCI